MNDEVPTDPGRRLALGQGLKLAGVVASMLTITVSKPASAKVEGVVSRDGWCAMHTPRK
jgi:hypothetical protein